MTWIQALLLVSWVLMLVGSIGMMVTTRSALRLSKELLVENEELLRLAQAASELNRGGRHE